jgi:GDP-L-fucose synthase
MNKNRVFIAGHKGMVGSAIVKKLQKDDNIEIIISDRKKLDFTNQIQVEKFFAKEKIDQVYIAAAKVGGIQANNTYPGEFIYKNLMIQTNIIHSAHLNNIQKILFLGSSCIYPKNSNQPITEDQLLTGHLETTNEPYAIAKIAGIKLCESYNRQYGRNYRSVMPTNLFGPGDNYHPENSHVIPGLIRRFHEAKLLNLNKVKVWGSGKPKREFLYVDDLAEACIFIQNLSEMSIKKMSSSMLSHINIGTGKDCTIKELAYLISDIVGFKGDIIWDTSKPDGTFRKLLDVRKLTNLGWEYKTSLKEGLIKTYETFLKSYNNF